MRLKEGDSAPPFTLLDEEKHEHTLSEFLGSWVLLYFYPKDDTPGCTVEATGFRDHFDKLTRAGVVVLGVSKDTVPSHKRFKEKYKLPFFLLSDKEKELAKRYGALGKKKFMGREYMGVLRNSYLIDPKGVVRKIYEKVDPKRHAEQVLGDVETFKA